MTSLGDYAHSIGICTLLSRLEPGKLCVEAEVSIQLINARVDRSCALSMAPQQWNMKTQVSCVQFIGKRGMKSGMLAHQRSLVRVM